MLMVPSCFDADRGIGRRVVHYRLLPAAMSCQPSHVFRLVYWTPTLSGASLGAIAGTCSAKVRCESFTTSGRIARLST